MSTVRVLLVEGNFTDQQALQHYIAIARLPYHCTIADSLPVAQSIVSQQQIDLVVLGSSQPDAAMESLTYFQTQQLPVIVAVPQGEEDGAVQLLQQGAESYVIKDAADRYLKLLPILIDRIMQDKQTQQHLQKLEQQASRDRLVRNLAFHIRQSIHLQSTLDTIVANIQEVLQVDRAIAYRFCAADGGGVVIAEAVTPQWNSILGQTIRDEYFAEHFVEPYKNGRIQIIKDIYTEPLSDCHKQLLHNIQVKATIIVPVVYGDHLWGLLVAQQCSGARDWEISEVELLQLLSSQMAIAIQQAELYERAQQELQERRQVEIALRQSEARLQTVVETSATGLVVVDLDGCILLTNPAAEQMLGRDRQQLLGKQIGIPYAVDAEIAQEIELLQPNQNCRVAEMQTAEMEWKGKRAYLLSLVDTTKRSQTERQLQASLKDLADFRYALDRSAIVTIMDTQGRINYANYKFCEISQYSREELLGQNHHIFDSGYHSHQFFRNLWRIISSGQVWRGEIRNRAKDGSIFWVDTTIIPFLDEDSVPWQYLTIRWDITAQKQAEEAFRESEAHYQQLLNHLPAGVIVHTADTRVLVSNPKACELLELTAEQMHGKTVLDQHWQFLREDGTRMPVAEYPVNQVIATQQPLKNYVVGVNRPSRESPVWVLVNAFPLFEADRGLSQVVVTFTDITDRVQAEATLRQLNQELEARVAERTADLQQANNQLRQEMTKRERIDEALRQTNQLLTLVMDSIPQRIFWKDCNSVIVGCNRNFAADVGLSPEAVVGKDMTQLSATPLEVQGYLEADRRVLATGEAELHIVETMRKADDSVIWLDTNKVPLRDSNGTVIGLLCTYEDITERREAELVLQHNEELLRITNAELARATRLKDEFLANMSHELRTPLNAILGLSEGLLDELFGTLNPKQKKFLDTIERSGRHLLELINDILDLAKIEAGKFELDKTSFSLTYLCEICLPFVSQQAHKQNVHLTLDAPDQLAPVQADERRMKQVIINLLTNAVKFTPDGGQVSLHIQPDAEAGTIALAISDTGIGIAPEDTNKLFLSFSQIDSSLSRQREGTGLGLALVKRIIDLHGGSVAVESTVGEGSRFTVWLPYSDPLHPTDADEESHASWHSAIFPSCLSAHTGHTARPTLLLAEDNLTNIETLVNYLEGMGYRLLLAGNGIEAIEQTKAHHPNLILMDIQMPELDGLEAIRILRSEEETAAIPIVALTALAMPGDRERCLAAGANEYMMKPVRLKQLAVLISNLLQTN